MAAFASHIALKPFTCAANIRDAVPKADRSMDLIVSHRPYVNELHKRVAKRYEHFMNKLLVLSLVFLGGYRLSS